MVTVRSAIQVGFRLVNKNKQLLIIPLAWEVIRALLLFSGFSLGSSWPLEPRFFIRFAIPASWPTFDTILPSPVLSPDFAFLLTGRLQGLEWVFLGGIVLFAILDSLARSWFLVTLQNAFVGEGVQYKIAFYQAAKFINQFIILRLIVLVGFLLITALAIKFPFMPPGFWDMLCALGTITITFVDLVIIFGNSPMPSALFKGIGILGKVGVPLVSFLIWGSVINAALSIPLNWAVGFFPAFVVGIGIFMYAGVVLSAGLMYLFTTSLLTIQEC
ncbi:MAG: hypothetical protein WA118_06150 [Carboxydocellales bacterium]